MECGISSSVKAINAKALEVTFDKAIDTTKASIVVKKGNVIVNVDSMKFSDDKKSVTIDTTSKLTKGEYTVTVTGLSEEALVGKVTVADEKVAKINVLSETAPMDSTDKQYAYVNYEVLNQYGEKITNQSINWTVSTGKVATDAGPGKLRIESASGAAFIPGSKVYLTGVHGPTATVVNAEVTIGLESKAAVAEVKGVYNTATNKMEELPAGFASGKYALLFEVKDQYGNKMDIADTAFAANFTALSDNPLFIATPSTIKSTNITVDEVEYEALELVPGNDASKGGTANIQLISNNTGNKVSYKITADALPAVKNFTISAPSKLIAGKEKVEIPFEAVDQYGNAVTKFSALNSDVTLSPSSLFKFEKQQDGSAKLFYTAPTNTGATDSIQTLTTLISSNGNYSNVQLAVKPDAKAEAVIGLSKDISTKVASGNNEKIKGEDLLVQDQYGRTMTKDQLTSWLTATDVDGGDNAIVITSTAAATTPFEVKTVASSNADAATQVISLGSEVLTVEATTATGLASNNEKLVFSLSTAATPSATTAISSSAKSVTFTRVAQSEYVSYEVADLGTMYNDGVAATKTNAKYDVKPKVYGVTQDGSKVLLPTSKYTITTDAGAKLTVTDGVISDQITTGYVKEDDFVDANGAKKDIPVKVTILVNDGNGAAAATIEKNLVVSNTDQVAKTVTLSEEVVNGTAFIDRLTAGNQITADNLNSFVEEIKDQYGVVITPTADITISNVTKVEGSTLAVSGNATSGVVIDNASTGDKFTATYKYAGGQTATVNFVVSSTTTTP